MNTNATFKYFYFNTAGGNTSTGRYRLIGDTLVLTHSKSKKEELVIKVTERLTSSPTVKLKFKVWQSGSKRPYPGAVFQLNKGYHGVTSDRTGEASVQVNTTMGDTMQICIKGYNIIRYPVQPKKDVEFGIEVDFLRYFNEGGDEFIPIIEARQNRITMNRGGVRFVFDRIDEGKLGELYNFYANPDSANER